MKTEQIRVRMPSDDFALVRELAESTTLQTGDVVAMLFHAAVQAVRENGGRVMLPVNFHLHDGPRGGCGAAKPAEKRA